MLFQCAQPPLEYVAPELVAGRSEAGSPVSPAADTFALGMSTPADAYGRWIRRHLEQPMQLILVKSNSCTIPCASARLGAQRGA